MIGFCPATWFTRAALGLNYQKLNLPRLEAKLGDWKMVAIARALSRASGTNVDVDTLKTLLMFCGAGLTVSLILASYGLDLSPGFF